MSSDLAVPPLPLSGLVFAALSLTRLALPGIIWL